MTKESDETRGMSLRELVLEVRAEVKDQNKRIDKRPTRMEIYGTVGLGASLIFGLVAFVG